MPLGQGVTLNFEGKVRSGPQQQPLNIQ